MSKDKIAESIIIRVGGGIREVPRESADIRETLEPTHQDSAVEQIEDVRPIGTEPGSNTRSGAGKVIN